MSSHFADRLLAAAERKGAPVCVGLDPKIDRLPDGLRGEPPIEAVGAFCRGVLEAVAAIVPAVKPQIAYFEALGPPGTALYFDLVREAKERGLLVIGDVKRGDIGSTAEAYAAAHLAAEDAPDAVTVNGYFGADGIAPLVEVCRAQGKGVFVLVRTSNPSSAAIQDFQAADGTRFYEHMARQVADVGDAEGLAGQAGFSCVGAVVGATYPDEARRLRELMPRQIFLVPGYGAQGATAEDCTAAFCGNGTGAIVNASRSVIYAFSRDEYAGRPWRDAVSTAAKAFAEDISGALG